jgi:hypothetical protein
MEDRDETAPTLSDDGVRGLGYTHRDEDGYWQRPNRERRPYGAQPTSTTVDADSAMMSALVDAYDSDVSAAAADWCLVKQEADAQVAHDLEAAKAWEPRITVAPLTPKERQKLDRMMADGWADKPTVGAVKRRREGATKGPRYALVALEGEAEAVAKAPAGSRNLVLFESAYTLSRLIPEHLETTQVITVLVAAAHDAGLTEQEARVTICSALKTRGVL